MLTDIGRWVRPRLAAPWGSGLGLARTILALGTLGTLLATTPKVLMSPLAGEPPPPACGGLGHGGQIARFVCVAILLLVASGWRPRLTAIPHWYVAWSLIANATIQDGGDQ